MEVADQIVLMNKGRIEQVGGPRDLYEHPATEFVMTFVGEASPVGEGWVRPHDIRISQRPLPGADEALVERIVHLGFEVRVDLALGDGTPLQAQLTRDEADALELEERQIVYVVASEAKVFG